MKKMMILQTVIPDYRKKFFTQIKNQLKDKFLLVCGNEYFEDSVKTDNSISFIKKIKNYYLLNRKFLFQTGIWSDVLKIDILILEMNPRIISNWIILLIRRLLHKKTILWGHAWPRNGQNSKSDVVRNLMRNLAETIVVYTKSQANELRMKMPSKTILSAPNAVFKSNEMTYSNKEDSINNIIYVGRLTKNKKPLILVKAFLNILDRLPNKTNLIFVGEGEEKKYIDSFVRSNKLRDRVITKGHISNYDTLKKMYDNSLLSVSPGYVGLSITQSFGFGVPMLISKEENHSPELEAAEENVNTIFFKTDCVGDLEDKILLFFENKKYWINKRKEICTFCKSNYTVEVMANTFINIYNK